MQRLVRNDRFWLLVSISKTHFHVLRQCCCCCCCFCVCLYVFGNDGLVSEFGMCVVAVAVIIIHTTFMSPLFSVSFNSLNKKTLHPVHRKTHFLFFPIRCGDLSQQSRFVFNVEWICMWGPSRHRLVQSQIVCSFKMWVKSFCASEKQKKH